MPPNTAGALTRNRFFIIFLSITSLAIASLSSATAHFATVLRDRAKFDLVTPSHASLDITFQKLMENVLQDMVIVALISTLFSIFGVVLVIHPKWQQENCYLRKYYGLFQLFVGLTVLSIGAYAASRVRGFQTAFSIFDSEGHFPYYNTMYYGAVSQAAFGVLVAIVSPVRFVRDLRGY